MTDERPAFHAAIWQTPDDDLPRLVYADWLDERGEHDEAAFLRLLCAVRTCPPDVDRLRTLVAECRRAMARVPSSWVEDVCPVPPAVVVGAWVDVDHEANQQVLEFIRQRRRARTGLQPPGDLIPLRPDHEVRWPSQAVVDRLWGELQEVLSPAAACAIDGVPALVDVWSGVIMAVALGGAGYAIRRLSDTAGVPPRPVRLLGEEWAHGTDGGYECGWLRRAAHQFDPVNQPT